MDYIASLLFADTPPDILLLVKMNGELKVSCEIMPHTEEHTGGIMIHRFNSHAEAVTYQETHQAEIDGLISRATEQFMPIYEAMKSNAAQLNPPHQRRIRSVNAFKNHEYAIFGWLFLNIQEVLYRK